MKKLSLCALCLAGILFNAVAQKKPKRDKLKEVTISLDTVAAVCKDLPMSARTRVTVSSFRVTTPQQPSGAFGGNLATMLSNYLNEINCFRVLEQKSNMSDLDDEIALSKSSNADKNNRIDAKMASASYVISGEIIRYEVASKQSKIMGIGNKTNTATLGINIKVTDIRTRDVPIQRSFTAEKETGGGTSVGIGGFDFSNTNDQNPALQMAAEEVIKKAVIYIAQQKDQMASAGKPAVKHGEVSAPNSNSSTITLSNIEYDQLSALTNYIEKIKGVKSVNSDDFSDKKATLLIDHSIKFKELVDKILAGSGLKLSVSSMSKEDATLNVK